MHNAVTAAQAGSPRHSQTERNAYCEDGALTRHRRRRAPTPPQGGATARRTGAVGRRGGRGAVINRVLAGRRAALVHRGA
ncbi:hypothetical protein LV779_07275 [Streptomyces thinghirensis]|nr:hypothetical protein [Streptomyces thinghirensis]